MNHTLSSGVRLTYRAPTERDLLLVRQLIQMYYFDCPDAHRKLLEGAILSLSCVVEAQGLAIPFSLYEDPFGLYKYLATHISPQDVLAYIKIFRASSNVRYW